MRIIAGTAKGAHLDSPSGNDIRPTLDRVRESLFNIIAPRVESGPFLDLFAGTGANGIEALSRGAIQADFVDSDPRAITLIEKNLARTHLSNSARLIRGALPSCLARLTGVRQEKGYALVFADPPHTFTNFPGLLVEIANQGLLNENGLFVLEHDVDAEIGPLPGRLTLTREKRYGKTQLSFFEPTPNASNTKTS